MFCLGHAERRSQGQVMDPPLALRGALGLVQPGQQLSGQKLNPGCTYLGPLEMELLTVTGDRGVHGHWRWRCPWSLEMEVSMTIGDGGSCGHWRLLSILEWPRGAGGHGGTGWGSTPL